MLDTYSIMSYFEDEEGASKVADILELELQDDGEIFLCVINWEEMYYIALREGGKERAELYRNIIQRYSIHTVEANKELTLTAANYKVFHKMSYTDAFAAALAKNRKAIWVTGDNEFKSLEKEIKISWI